MIKHQVEVAKSPPLPDGWILLELWVLVLVPAWRAVWRLTEQGRGWSG